MEFLRQGELIIVPTETVYGLAGDLSLPGVLEKMFKAKGRPESKPIPLFARNRQQIERFGADMGPVAKRLAKTFWPGPLTLVLPTEKGFTGFRIPDYPPMLQLLENYGGIVGVTSANRSGSNPATTATEAEQALGSWVSLILDAGPSLGGVPSTVVKTKGEVIEILRAGAIPTRDIMQAAQKNDHGQKDKS